MVSNSQTKILKYAIDFGALTNPGGAPIEMMVPNQNLLVTPMADCVWEHKWTWYQQTLKSKLNIDTI